MIKSILRCTCCGKLFEDTATSLDHEFECRENPDNKCCETCARQFFQENPGGVGLLQACTKHGVLKDWDESPINCEDWRSAD